ncbi:hypothetical protein BaRGS_00016781, partial [Batillaria attramentaria]
MSDAGMPEPRDDVYEMNSVFDWNDVHVPLSFGGMVEPKTQQKIFLFEPPGKRLADLQPGTYVTSFVREPSPRTSPKRTPSQTAIIQENTYQLEPSTKFQPGMVEPTMLLILSAHLE